MEKENIRSSKVLNKLSIKMAIAGFLSYFGTYLGATYISYCYTDLAGIPVDLATSAMTLVTTLGVVLSFFDGAVVQNSHSKLGHYRPWILFGRIVVTAGCTIVFLHTGNVWVDVIMLSIGYFMYNTGMDFVGTSQYALYMQIAGDNEEARGYLSGRVWVGSSICGVVIGLVADPLVAALGGDDASSGYIRTQLIFLCIWAIGIIIDFVTSKPYDPSNVGVEGEKAESLNIIEMVKGIIANRPGLMCVLADIIRFTGYYVQLYLMAYQCEYVLGNVGAMGTTLSVANFGSMLGNLVAPFVCEKLGGRKKGVMFFSITSGLAFLAGCFFGQTLVGFIACNTVAYFLMSFIDAMDVPMYGDAGEYYLNKTGKDTRAYMMSWYSVAVKIAIALSTVALGFVLNLINYTPGMDLDAAGKTALTIATGIGPAIGYGGSAFLLLIHGVSDDEMARCIKENTEKYGASEE